MQQARNYLVQLINIDRRRNGLAPVALDAIASKAGQLHTDKMMRIGARGHFEPDGSKPPQRYNLVGGTDYVAENVYWVGNIDRQQTPDPKATFTRISLYNIENWWMNSPLHRANVLDKDHTHVGIGLSKSKDGTTISAAQEFINKYGNIGKIPARAYRGTRVGVSGSLTPGFKAQSIDVFYEDFPRPMSVATMNATGSYGLPNARVTTIFPDKMAISSNGFGVSIDVKPEWKPGLYYCVVWVQNNRNGETIPVSILTFYVI